MELKEIVVSVMTLATFWGIAIIALKSVKQMDKTA